MDTIAPATYTLNVKKPVDLVRAFVNLFGDADTTLSLTGSLDCLDSHLLEEGAYRIQEHTEYSGTITITLTERNVILLTRSILPRVGLHRRIHEIEIAKNGEQRLGSYDNFYPQLTWVGPDIDSRFLDQLVADGILRCYYLTPAIEESIMEHAVLWWLIEELCANLPEVESVGAKAWGFARGNFTKARGYNVVGLGLFGAGLTRLPRALKLFDYLEVLSLANNNLKALGNTLTKCSRLQVLYATSNELEVLPETLGRLTRLKELDLSNNQLRSLPESIADLRSLQGLDLRGNSLEELPANFANLISLRSLDLTDNPLSNSSRAVAEIMRKRGCQVGL